MTDNKYIMLQYLKFHFTQWKLRESQSINEGRTGECLQKQTTGRAAFTETDGFQGIVCRQGERAGRANKES